MILLARLLLAAATAAVVLSVTLAGFLALLDLYRSDERRGPTPVSAPPAPATPPSVRVDRFGQLEVDGEPWRFERFRNLWLDADFRRRHCGRWRVVAAGDAPRQRVAAVRGLVSCPPER